MTKKDDPYHDIKIYHMAHLISAKGHVSPLCAEKPRKINLRLAMWTIRKEAVTCKKCKRLLQKLAVSEQTGKAASKGT
jgi:hypothetical protein